MKIELLAPAKNLEVGRIAIDSGADAVYIGGPSFGARKAAGNSLEDIGELCRYAHLMGAKVLVTLNTLLRGDEYQEAVRLAYAYKQLGVDAIIIQYLELARLLFATGDFNGENGGTRLHASTQCDNRTIERVQELERMGFKRVVLARELSFEQIHAIRKETTCELESFVHGALCVSYSGACYLSEAVCGRSANRGECAQMCRLAYDVLDENQQVIRHPKFGLLQNKHILSLRDLDRSPWLEDLLETGITTLKIEGRLKDADYVRNVVAHYHQLLNHIVSQSNGRYERASHGLTHIQFTPNPEKTFHRGATPYFSTGRPDQLVNMDTPKSTGEYLGCAPITAAMGIHNGDGICFGNEGFYWPNNRIRIPDGTPIYRNYDADFQRQLSAKDATTRVLPVNILFEETNSGFRLQMTDPVSGRTATVDTPAEKTPAQNAERAESVVRQQLGKLGGTRLESARIDVKWATPYFLPASLLNEWRRGLVETFLSEPTIPSTEVPEVSLSGIRSAYSGDLPDNLMTCKYCILNELGCCKKSHPQKTGIPTYLRQNGLLLRILTDCRKCEMMLQFANR